MHTGAAGEASCGQFCVTCEKIKQGFRVHAHMSLRSNFLDLAGGADAVQPEPHAERGAAADRAQQGADGPPGRLLARAGAQNLIFKFLFLCFPFPYNLFVCW